MRDLRVIPATSTDIARIEALQQRATAAIPEGAYSADEIADVLPHAAHPDPGLIASGRYFMGLIGDTLAGCGGWAPARFEKGAAEVRGVFTDPGHAGRGVGRTLVEHVVARAREAGFVARAREAGFTEIRVRSSLNATEFYARLGLRELRPMLADVGAPTLLRTAYMALKA